ncbi:uroporphyrinogen decarboxylase [Microbacter margulisiae]|uniref:Uroporphyrinogen decarboxylase n=1 Tax=Microbacter margulisiae TaxID=1350067 RepID=A0A7W5DND9_9PORP|nr:uroporphyrinogen decarboxylase [Microbacter margulisiae]MBB3186119.1 uroporphyrinogen decarboxylase [Microbacter margulisiae]
MSNSVFIRTIRGERCERPPVWFMRQAGRVLPSYLSLREKYSFRDLMHNPELTAKVTLLPVQDLGVDAAILFSDILVIPEALGMELNFTDKGPVFDAPIKNQSAYISRLQGDTSKLSHIYKAIDLIKVQKPEDCALIGFCGSPFTTLCYMVQGSSANHFFPDAIKLIYSHRQQTSHLLELITELSIEYAVNQVKHGIDAFQLFETHAGLLPYELYVELVLPYVKRITSAVRDAGCPVIFFPKGLGAGLKQIHYDVADYISVDWQDSMEEARRTVDPRIGLQGNFDPRIFSIDNPNILISELEKYKAFGRNNFNWIFNTGHGLSPDNLFHNVRRTVDWIKTTDWQR